MTFVIGVAVATGMSGSVSLSCFLCFSVDAVGVVGRREDDGEKDEEIL